MALIHADRVEETSTTTGTGTYSLAGAVTGFRTFVAGIGDTNTCYYCATDNTNWEVGLGTVTDAATDTLARTTILASSNAGAAVNWAAGTRNIFVTIPADRLLRNGVLQLTTSGTTKDFTIPSTATRITVMFNGVSTNGSSSYLIQLGDSGGIEATSYDSDSSSGATNTHNTIGFGVVGVAVSGGQYNGAVTLSLVDGNTWASSGNLAGGTTIGVHVSAGIKTLSAALTTVRITSVNPNTFDAGSVNVQWQ